MGIYFHNLEFQYFNTYILRILQYLGHLPNGPGDMQNISNLLVSKWGYNLVYLYKHNICVV